MIKLFFFLKNYTVKRRCKFLFYSFDLIKKHSGMEGHLEWLKQFSNKFKQLEVLNIDSKFRSTMFCSSNIQPSTRRGLQKVFICH
jgi:formamidopyrimidine-DNA glycosylase